MNHIKNSLASFVGLFLIIVGVTAFIPALAQEKKSDAAPTPPTAEVKVVNPASEPVPIAGTVNVGNLGANPLLVRDVDNLGNGGVFRYNGPGAAFTVPDGQRLVIEYVSVWVLASEDCEYLVAALSTGGFSHRYFPTLVGRSGVRPVYGLSQETRMHALENDLVSFDASGSGCSILGKSTKMSGYFAYMQ